MGNDLGHGDSRYVPFHGKVSGRAGPGRARETREAAELAAAVLAVPALLGRSRRGVNELGGHFFI